MASNEDQIMMDRIRNILQRLEQTREDLLALSDDIWLSIDHNDKPVQPHGTADGMHERAPATC